MEALSHQFEPVFDNTSRVLILGTFPSVKSREMNFYYGHPQNRFWKVLAALTNEPLPMTTDEKKSLLLKHHIAIWDVIQSCEIQGSSDASIRNVVANDISLITSQAPVTHIYANGAKAYELFMRYCKNPQQLPVSKLPSTSPANAACSLDRLIQEWRCIL